MAKARIGHFVEAQVLEALEVDYIDESEVLTPADEANHIDKWAFKVPFVCGATNLGEALRRIAEGAAMIRSKGEAGTGNVVEAVRHMRLIGGEIRRLTGARRDRAGHRRQGAAGAARPGPRGRRDGQAAGRAVLRRRHRHPGRRRADDAAGRRGRVRGLGHLQVRGPRAHAARPSSRPPRTSRTPSASPPPRATSGAAMAGLEMSAVEADGGRCCRRAAGEPGTVGVLALQGDFEAHAKRPARARRRARATCAPPRTSRGSTRWSSPAASRPR